VTERTGPIDWARQQQAEREHAVPGCGDAKPHPAHRYMQHAKVSRCLGAEQQPARHTADTITSDALDQLYTERDEARTAAARYFTNGTQAVEEAGWRAHHAEQRAEQAEAALTRARGYAAHLDQYADATASVADRALFRAIATDLRAALDPQETP
jgi:hypothetical protein